MTLIYVAAVLSAIGIAFAGVARVVSGLAFLLAALLLIAAALKNIACEVDFSGNRRLFNLGIGLLGLIWLALDLALLT